MSHATLYSWVLVICEIIISKLWVEPSGTVIIMEATDKPSCEVLMLIILDEFLFGVFIIVFVSLKTAVNFANRSREALSSS